MGGRGESELSRGVRFPENDSQTMHMFANRKGHLVDTEENRKLVLSIIKEENHIDTKKSGAKYYSKNILDKGQIWCEIRNGIVQDCGLNNPAWNIERIKNYIRRKDAI